MSQRDASYLMGRDASASLRLTYQHWILKERQGWLLHPTISRAIQHHTTLQIADLGCGNGIWSIETANLYPHAHITAMDISQAQFAPSSVSPSNISWVEHDISNPTIPSHLLNNFDIIYIRFLIQSAPTLSIDIVLNRTMKMLKPGGWVQWDEMVPPVGGLVDPVTLQPVEGPPHPAYAIPNELYGTWKRIERVLELDAVFREYGLGNTELVRPGFNRLYLRAGTDNNVVGAREWCRTVTAKLGDGELKARIVEATDRMQKDVSEGKFFGLFYVVAIGQRSV